MSGQKSLRDMLNTSYQSAQIVGVSNAFEASLAAKNGADAIWISSLCLGLNEMLPDENIVSTETIGHVIRRIRRCNSLPILVDGGEGGSPSQLLHLLRVCEESGAQGLSIEDQRYPKKNSLNFLYGGLAEISVFTEKLEVLVRARQSNEFVIVARNEALVAGFSLEVVFERASICMNKGVDAIFLHCKDVDQKRVIQFARKWNLRLPLIVCPTRFPMLTRKEATENKISAIIYANQGMRAYLKALDTIFSLMLQQGSAAAVEKYVAPLEELLSFAERFSMRRADSNYISSLLKG